MFTPPFGRYVLELPFGFFYGVCNWHLRYDPDERRLFLVDEDGEIELECLGMGGGEE